MRIVLLGCLGVVFLSGFQRMSPEEVRKLKNPVPFTRKSIAAGKTTFLSTCAACHGPDGKAQVDVVADATDLTNPKAYKSGSSDGEIFRSIRDGAGETMPPFAAQLSGDTEIWNLVNYIHSLWPENMRPPLVEEKSKE
ncbi:MAG TPA: cytochrome c [Bryobacteraceae bacterium]|nr:cytochrome c [Bryobacteraceae bacterium]